MGDGDTQGASARGASCVCGDRRTDRVATAGVDQIWPDARHDVVGILVERCAHGLGMRPDDRKPDELLEHIADLITAVVGVTQPLSFEWIVAEGVSCHRTVVAPGLDAGRARFVHGGQGQTGDSMFWGNY